MAAVMLEKLNDNAFSSRHDSTTEMAQFVRGLIPKIKDKTVSNQELKELWQIFAPTCDWDDNVGDAELGNEIFDLIERNYRIAH